MMPWKIFDKTQKKTYEFNQSQVVSIGTHEDCEINTQISSQDAKKHSILNQKLIHSQLVLDDGFIFHVVDHKICSYFLFAEIKIENITIVIEYLEKKCFSQEWHLTGNQCHLFASDEFLQLLSEVQKTFFEFHKFQVEMRKISVVDMVQHAAKILTNQILNPDLVYQSHQRTKFKELIWCLWAQIFEYGLLTPAILNPEISEIMVNGHQEIYFEKQGKIIAANISFRNESEILSLIERICASVGRRIDESIPYCDARLKEGHRAHAIIAPLSLIGPCLTIRKFPNFSYDIKKLIENYSISLESADILKEAIMNKKNIVISGGTGSGKTTLLNCLSAFIPKHERILTIEDSAELRLQQPHVIRLECRNENIESQGKITMRDLLRNALRMRPDRIIIGECRGAEALDMLQAMNTGHDGSMTTVHANSPQDALRRLETLVLFSEVDLPSQAIREQLSSAIHLIVQQSRLSCGRRCITQIDRVGDFDFKTLSIRTETIYFYDTTQKMHAAY